MWKLRESVPEAQRHHGASLKHDVSVPVSRIPRLIERGRGAGAAARPRGRGRAYGHLGDGNLHFNVSQRPAPTARRFWRASQRSRSAMFDLVEELGGSISAEHGIGRLKRGASSRGAPIRSNLR